MSKVSQKICILDCKPDGNRENNYLLNFQYTVDNFSTIGVKIYRQVVELTDTEITCHFLIWHLASHSKYNRPLKSYLKGSSAAIVIADLNQDETIEKLVANVQLFLSINPHGLIIAILNEPEPGKNTPIIYLLRLKKGDKLILTYQIYPNTYKLMDEILKTLALHIVKGDIIPVVSEDTIIQNIF